MRGKEQGARAHRTKAAEKASSQGSNPSSSPGALPQQDRLEIYREHRALLFSIAYRMLGSLADAEDILQETFIRWQQAPLVEIQSPKAFLVTIVTRLCLSHLESARAKREECFGEWLPEPLLSSSCDPKISHIDGSLSMAFLVLLQRLNPAERAVFLLREIFEYDYAEIASMLGQSEANCRQIFRRARQHVKKDETRFAPSHQDHEKLLEQFIHASNRGDMGGLLAMLSREAVFCSDGGAANATAVPNRIEGCDQVARLICGALSKLAPGPQVERLAQINGCPGIISYLDGRPFRVLTLDVVDNRICGIYVVSNPDKLTRIPSLADLPTLL